MLKTLGAFVLFLLAATAGRCASAPPAAQVELTQLDAQNQYYIHGVFETSSSPEEVWRVLSDYEGLQGILDSLRSSKVLERNGDKALVEQVMVGKFLFFSKVVDLRLEITEQAPWRIAFISPVGGPFKHYEGAWQIDRTPTGCRVDYTLDVSRGDMAPPFLERKLFQENSLTLLKKLSREVERRANLPVVLGSATPAVQVGYGMIQGKGAIQ